VAEGRELTYADLDRAATSCARRLWTLGVRSGDVVATTLRPGLAFAELLHALPRLGAALAPLDPRAPARFDGLVLSAPPDAPEAPDAELSETVDPKAVHTVVRSSGTTGVPKAIELTYANHAASVLASADGLGAEPGDRWLTPLPLHHVGGLGVLIRSVVNRTTAIVHERFDVQRVRAALEGGEATLASLVPTMLARLREAGLSAAPGLRAVALGGGPAAPDLLAWAERAGIPVVPVYGMTETASQVVAGIPGRPLRGAELRVEDGELLVRGPMVARSELAADGWLHTGDAGRLDAAGRLHLEGRIKDLIVTGGEKVAPSFVEAALAAHPAVADAGVVGVPDADWGEAVTAFVVLRGPAAPEALRDWCRARLAPHEVPKRVVAVDTLPRNAAGKLVRTRLGEGTV
jgi:O-succinylbenzoic acid--CoA ligase